MIEPHRADPGLGTVLFRCRPQSLRQFFALRYQGALPLPLFVTRTIALVSPILETLILTGIPPVVMAFVVTVVFGLKPPNEASWLKPACAALLTVSFLVSVWWIWLTPRSDNVIVCERGFRWRVSLARWEWFRARGSVASSNLKAFSYRSDCFEPAPLESGKTPGEKLSRIWLEVNLSRHDIMFHLRNGKDIVIERLFARFDHADLRRFLDHLATVAEPQSLEVQVLQPGTRDTASDSRLARGPPPGIQ